MRPLIGSGGWRNLQVVVVAVMLMFIFSLGSASAAPPGVQDQPSVAVNADQPTMHADAQLISQILTMQAATQTGDGLAQIVEVLRPSAIQTPPLTADMLTVGAYAADYAWPSTAGRAFTASVENLNTSWPL